MDDLLSVFKNMNLEDNQEGMAYNSRVLLVDATNLFIRSYAAVPSMDDNGNHIGGMVGFLKSLGLAIRTFKPTRTIVVFDGKGGSQRRRKLYPEYKKNRKPPVRLNRSYDLTTDEEEKENMKFQLISLVEILENLPLTIFAVDHVEADDVIAYLSQLVELDGGSSIIYSTDKDFFQLASDSVIVYNPVKKKMILPPSYDYVKWKCIRGDKTDNIPGLPKFGDKTAEKYVKDESLYKTLVENKEYSEILERNKSLIELSDISCLDEKIELNSSISFDKEKVFEMFESLEFTSLTKETYFNNFSCTFEKLCLL